VHPINWQQFGLKGNPYDTLPLVEGGEVSLEAAFVGRERERQVIESAFSQDSRAAIAICGDVGVGKTSLANMEKFSWKYGKTKPLFSFRREIEASVPLLNKREFILEIIGSTLREITLVDPRLLQQKTLRKLNRLVDVSFERSLTFSAGVAAGVINGSVGVSAQTTLPQEMSMSSLEKCLWELLQFVSTEKINGRRHQGLIIHMNNFDVAIEQDRPRVRQFFQDIRDVLQMPHLYALFLGPRDFFDSVISTHPRVRSMFSQPIIQLEPLSKEEILEVFRERMTLLRSHHVKQVTEPIALEVISALYDLHAGDIRSIMASINHILSEYPNIVAHTLNLSEAMLLLGQWQWEQVTHVSGLTREQQDVLRHIARAPEQVNQKELARMLHKAEANISGYYMKPLKERGVIELKEKKGREKYWGIASAYMPLAEYLRGGRNAQATHGILEQ